VKTERIPGPTWHSMDVRSGGFSTLILSRSGQVRSGALALLGPANRAVLWISESESVQPEIMMLLIKLESAVNEPTGLQAAWLRAAAAADAPIRPSAPSHGPVAWREQAACNTAASSGCQWGKPLGSHIIMMVTRRVERPSTSSASGSLSLSGQATAA
jgi:hypothetical protein